MAMTVMHNNGAMLALGTLNRNVSSLGKELKKISSGERITGASDDASGYSISEKMRIRIRALSQADQNTQTGTSMVRTAERAIQNQIDILRTIKAKVLDAANDSNTDIDREIIQKEIDQGYMQMEEIAYTTNFNGKLLLCGGDVKERTHTNWSEEPLPEFGIQDHNTRDIGLITKAVSEDKSSNATAQARVLTDMNEQPGPSSDAPASTTSIYDVADVYSYASATSGIGNVSTSVQMSNGVSWQAATNTVTLNLSGLSTATDVLNSLKNRSFTVSLANANGTTTTKQFTFADDLRNTGTFGYSFTYDYTDTNLGTQTRTVNSTVSVELFPTVTYSSGATTISLQAVKNAAGNSATEAANRALGALANAIASSFGTYDVDGTSGSASQARIYGDSLVTTTASSVLTLAAGENDFTITDGTDTPASYGDVALAIRVQALANAARSAAIASDLSSIGQQGQPTSNISSASITSSTAVSSTSGSNGTSAQLQNHVQEEYAYCDISLDDLVAGTTDIESMIEKFLYKERDDELDATDADTSDRDIFDTGNNHVIDRALSFIGYNSQITYEFIDTNRPNSASTTAGTQYIYDEQKIPGSNTVDLNRLRTIYNGNGGNVKKAVAQFLYETINYTTYGRNASYTREALDASGNVINSAADAESLRFYAYRPYSGSDSSSAARTKGSSYFDSNSYRYATGRYSGDSDLGNIRSMDTNEAYLCSYDLDFKEWWARNIGDPTAVGNEDTAVALGNRLNQRGFRFYCGAESGLKEWVNIYFTDHSIEEDLEMERPQAGNEPLSTGDKIDTIMVDIRNIKNYKELVNAVYKQANLRANGGQASNASQVGFSGNPLTTSAAHTDYFSHLQFAMDEETGILTIFDTDRSAHGREMYVSDGVYDNVRLEYREIYEKRLVIHDTDKASQAVVVCIPRTTMDHVFGFNAAKKSLSSYSVLKKSMRDQLLGADKNTTGILDRGLKYLLDANTLLGAQMNRLEYSHSNLVTSVENTQSSESTLRDADMAKEMTSYTRSNVLLQASQSMLAQANQNSSSVLSLLQ